MPMVAQPLRKLPTLAILFFCASCHNFITSNFLETIIEQAWQIAENFAQIATIENKL
jgi:hypothetical protein